MIAPISGYDVAMNTSPPLSLDALLRKACERIDAADARLLLAHVVGNDPSWLYAHGSDEATVDVSLRFQELLEARLAGQPVAYLTGTRGFWTLALEVNSDTLIPRPETERLVELSLARLPPGTEARVADLGTGSGAIALAIAKERPQAQVIATDASPTALEVARRNACANQISNVEFRQGHWFAPLEGERFDLIASNPPYIANDDLHLRQGDLRFEPMTALSSGTDGLDDIRQIVRNASGYLSVGGWLLLEHGFDQAASIRDLLRISGFIDIATEQDLESRDRVTLGRTP